VVNLIEIKNQNRFIKEISAIYMAFEHGLVVEPVTQPVVVQSKVEVISGILKGIQGVVTSIKDQLSLILEVNGLGSAAVHIDVSQVRVIA
jgi:transcription antitermination factor NusG